ncbi:MAG TPA: FAD-binding oxidoreductase, partial [Dehalococcoidia bacterium]|nr:FAD-binding oxidoreductase [Dehalococcoidia bacterium]
MDRAELIRALQGIVGERYVLFTEGDRLAYEGDGSIDRALPDLVVLPKSTEEVAAVVRLAHREGIPLIPRGAGTGLSGGMVAVAGGILLVLSRMKAILEVDLENQVAVVEPGLVNLDLSLAV